MRQHLRPERRGHTDIGWLDSRHTFSFGEFQEPTQMGFRVLRVVNDDRVAPGKGFGSHGHRDMEIVSYVVAGELEHKDSLGTVARIKPGDVQRMTAGTGVVHSEYNASPTEPVRFLQIWIPPARRGLPPGYEQKFFPDDVRRGRLCLVASADGTDGSITIHQDVRLFAALLAPGDTVTHPIPAGRHAWVQVVGGSIDADGELLVEGSGLAISGEAALTLRAQTAAELLLFDLP